MAVPKPISELYDALGDLSRWMEAEHIEYCLIGGVAVSFLAEPRMTRDVDATAWVEPERLQAFLDAGKTFGLDPRIPRALAFAAQSRMLLLIHQPSGIQVDISLAGFQLERDFIRRAVNYVVDGVPVKLPTVGDLVVMKSVAGRLQDWADVEKLMDKNPRISLPTIRKRLRAWCTLVDSEDAIAEFEAFMTRRRKRMRR